LFRERSTPLGAVDPVGSAQQREMLHALIQGHGSLRVPVSEQAADAAASKRAACRVV
jgi:hypothetical protein